MMFVVGEYFASSIQELWSSTKSVVKVHFGLEKNKSKTGECVVRLHNHNLKNIEGLYFISVSVLNTIIAKQPFKYLKKM